MQAYLTTREVADLLRLKERKVYDLAAAGEVPCARVTGKLLFPAREIEAWIAAGRSGPGATPPVPEVFLGSHDPLLDWALRASGCGLATYFDGSLDGLSRFAARGGVGAGLHIESETTGTWNIEAVSRSCGMMNAVLVRFATRRRGLITRADAGIAGLPDLRGRSLVPRQAGAGAQICLERRLLAEGIDAAEITRCAPAQSEADAVLSVRHGEADAAFGLEALAAEYELDFVPVVEERFDLLLDRRAWFEAPMQTLMAFCAGARFRARAEALAGYDIERFGDTLWNAG